MADDGVREDINDGVSEVTKNQILQEQARYGLCTMEQDRKKIYQEPPEVKKAQENARATLDARFATWQQTHPVQPRSLSSDDEDDDIDTYVLQTSPEFSRKIIRVKRAAVDGKKIVVSFLRGYGTKTKGEAKSVVQWLLEHDQNDKDHHRFYSLKDTANKLGRRLTRTFVKLFLIVSKTEPVLAAVLKDYASSLPGFVGATTDAIVNKAVLLSNEEVVNLKVLNMDVEELTEKITKMLPTFDAAYLPLEVSLNYPFSYPQQDLNVHEFSFVGPCLLDCKESVGILKKKVSELEKLIDSLEGGEFETDSLLEQAIQELWKDDRDLDDDDFGLGLEDGQNFWGITAEMEELEVEAN